MSWRWPCCFFEAIRDDERTSVLNDVQLRLVAGDCGRLVDRRRRVALGRQIARAYLTIFGLSCVARVAALALLKRVPEFNRTLEQLPSPRWSKPPWQSSKRWYLPSKCPQLPAKSIAA